MCKPCVIVALVFALVVFGSVGIIWRVASGATSSVVINEIAWMGTTNSATDEWIELANTSSATINLDGWSLKAQDGSPEINLTGLVPANGYFLLERTDDSSAPFVTADQIYTGALKNTGEALTLYDANLIAIDTVSGWSWGDNATKETMARTSNLTWVNGPINGTPKTTNNSGGSSNTQTNTQNEETEEETTPPPPEPQLDTNKEIFKTEELTGEENPTSQNTTTESSTFTKTNDVIISEFIPDPEGSDSELEWIEIFNKSEESHDISRWQLDDATGGSAPFTLSAGTIISPHGYLVFSRKTTALALNNDEDETRLLYPDGTIAHSVPYTKTKESYSYSLISSSDTWVWTNILTPGSANMQNKTTPTREVVKTSTVTKETEETSSGTDREELEANTLDAKQFSAQLATKDGLSIQTILLFFAIALISFSLGGTALYLQKKKEPKE